MALAGNAQLKTGIIAGVHLSDIKNTDLRETTPALFLHGGGLLEIGFPKSPFLVQACALYYPVGFGESNVQVVDRSGTAIPGTVDKLRVGYIRVPVHLLYKFSSSAGIYKLGIGSSIAFKVSDRVVMDGGEKFGNGTVSPTGTPPEPVLGGFEFQFSSQWSGIFAAFHFYTPWGSLYESNGPKWKPTAFGISFGYYFDLKK
jgi:hypothetical protein